MTERRMGGESEGTVEEDRLARWLKDGTPDPPIALLADEIVRNAARRQRVRTWAPVLAAACTVALVAALVPALNRVDDARPSRMHVRPDRSASTGNPGPTAADTGLGIQPWHARLISLRPALASLAVVHGRLYGSTYADGRIVRVDPGDGRVLARSSVSSTVPPVYFDGRIWIVVVSAGHGRGDRGSDQLVGLDPTSLATTPATHSVHISSDAPFGAVLTASATGGELAFGAGSRATVFGTDPTAGPVRVSAHGQISGLALSPDGSQLYVGVNSGVGGQLQTFDAATGAPTSDRSGAGDASGGLVATSGGLWYLSATGTTAQIVFARGPGLAPGSSPGAGASGGGQDVGPSLSGGVMWLGGDGELGCADPDTGRVRARTPIAAVHGHRGGTPGYVSGMSALHDRVLALYRGAATGPRHALIEMTPPRACGIS